LKKHLFKFLKYLIVMLLMISSGAALFFQLTGSFYDPAKGIHDLKSQNRRDEAIDILTLYKDSGTIDPDKLEQLEKDLEYTSFEKGKSFIDGVITGRVYDTFSGVGAIGSDLCVYGDIRDLSIQSWRYFRNEKTDTIVAILSGIGIILSAKPFADVIASYAKNSLKYLKKVPVKADGYLKKTLKGNLTLKESMLVFDLLKKTNGQSLVPQQSFQISTV